MEREDGVQDYTKVLYLYEFCIQKIKKLLITKRITPRLRTSEDVQMAHPSTSQMRSPNFWSSALGATTKSSVDWSWIRAGVANGDKLLLV